MKKKIIKLSEIVGLADEINNLVNENVPFTTKYWLNKLGNKVFKENKQIIELKNKLIEKFGQKQKETSITGEPIYSIAPESENFLKYNTELIKVLEVEIELEYKDFSIEEFKDVQSTNFYPNFYSLLD